MCRSSPVKELSKGFELRDIPDSASSVLGLKAFEYIFHFDQQIMSTVAVNREAWTGWSAESSSCQSFSVKSNRIK